MKAIKPETAIAIARAIICNAQSAKATLLQTGVDADSELLWDIERILTNAYSLKSFAETGKDISG